MSKPKEKAALERKVEGHLLDAQKLVSQGRPSEEIEEVLDLTRQFADEHLKTLTSEEKTQYELRLGLQLRQVRDALKLRGSGVSDKKGQFRDYSNKSFDRHLSRFLRSLREKGSFSELKSQEDGHAVLSYMDFALSTDSKRNHFNEIAESERLLFLLSAFYRAWLTRLLSLLWTKRESALMGQVVPMQLVVTGFLNTSSEIVSPHDVLHAEVVGSHGCDPEVFLLNQKLFYEFMIEDLDSWVTEQTLDKKLTWSNMERAIHKDSLLMGQGRNKELLLHALSKNQQNRKTG